MSSRLVRYILPVLLFSIIWGAVEFLIPIRYAEAGISITLVGFLFSVTSIISLLLDIPAGRLSDTIGRERMIVYSMFIAIAGLLLLYFFSSIWAFVVSAILIGTAYGLNWSPLLAFVGDHGDEHGNHGSVFGGFLSLDGLGEAIAPIGIAVLLLYSHTQFPFVLLAMAALVCAFIFIHLIKNNGRNTQGKIEDIRGHFSYKKSITLIKASGSKGIFLLTLGFFVAFFWQSVWFTQPLIGFYEKSILDSALIVAVFSLPAILLSKPLGMLTDRIGIRRMFIFSAFGTIVSFLGFYCASLLAVKITLIFTAAVGVCGIRLVLNTATARANTKQDRGEFFGIVETIKDGSYALAPIIIGASYTLIGLNGIFLVNSAIALLLLLFGARVLQRL